MDDLLTSEDRTALLRQGIAVLEAHRTDGRLSVGVTGGDEERVRAAVADMLGADTDVTVLDVLPRHLHVGSCVGYRPRSARELRLFFVVWGDEHIGDVFVVEDDRSVVVLGVICAPAGGISDDVRDDRFDVYLDQPLGDRTVYDGCGGKLVHYRPAHVSSLE